MGKLVVDLLSKDASKTICAGILAGSGARGSCSYHVRSGHMEFYWKPSGSNTEVFICSVRLPDDAADTFNPEREAWIDWIDVITPGVSAILSKMTGATGR